MGLPEDLRIHFGKLKISNQDNNACFLYILEDLIPEFIDLLGNELGADPHVFVEQKIAWYFTVIQSIARRQLVSLNRPDRSFTLRYHELRKPDSSSKKDLTVSSNHMTFAVNRRLYEPSIVVGSASIPTEDPVALVRRCASFWTSQRSPAKNEKPKVGWNAELSPTMLMYEEFTASTSVGLPAHEYLASQEKCFKRCRQERAASQLQFQGARA